MGATSLCMSFQGSPLSPRRSHCFSGVRVVHVWCDVWCCVVPLAASAAGWALRQAVAGAQSMWRRMGWHFPGCDSWAQHCCRRRAVCWCAAVWLPRPGCCCCNLLCIQVLSRVVEQAGNGCVFSAMQRRSALTHCRYVGCCCLRVTIWKGGVAEGMAVSIPLLCPHGAASAHTTVPCVCAVG